jgi:hypothetical protein
MFVAPVTAERSFARFTEVWQGDPYGLNLRSALRYATHVWQQHRSPPEALLAEPVCWGEIDFTTCTDPHVRGSGTSIVTRRGTAHGLLSWFDARLLDDVGFSNHPAAAPCIYGQGYFPWPSAVALEVGDLVDFELRADPIAGRYQWTWSSRIRRVSTPDVVEQSFRRSDLLSVPYSAEALRKRAADFQPTLGVDGELTIRALERIREGTTLDRLAAELLVRAPQRFSSQAEALDFVADVSARFSA